MFFPLIFSSDEIIYKLKNSCLLKCDSEYFAKNILQKLDLYEFYMWFCFLPILKKLVLFHFEVKYQ